MEQDNTGKNSTTKHSNWPPEEIRYFDASHPIPDESASGQLCIRKRARLTSPRRRDWTKGRAPPNRWASALSTLFLSRGKPGIWLYNRTRTRSALAINEEV